MASIMACNKVETSEQIEQQDGHNVIYATSEATKTTITDTGIRQVEWLEGDEAMVYNTSGEGKKYTALNGGTTAKFVSADGLTGDYCAAIYPASLALGCSSPTTITAKVPLQQDGNFRNLVFAGVPKTSGSNQFLFTAVTSIIKINVPSEKDIVKIEVESNQSICGQFTATCSNYKWTTANGDNLGNTITVTAEQGHTLPETVYIAVLPTSSNPEITIKGYKSTDSSDSPFYNKTAILATTLKANVIENFGTIQKLKYDPKAFTIDAEGHQVFIAPGNLQYQASTKTWRFAEHQWDYVGFGTDNATAGTVYVGSTKSTNENIGETYDGWIDLFGFGTTGCSIYPYMTSINENDYPNVSLSLEENFNYDWGRYCEISNDNYKDKKWHTITPEEWVYLHNRDNHTKWGYIQIKDIVVDGTTTKKTICGQLLLPDGFMVPEGVKFTCGYNTNTMVTYSMDDFKKMEEAGAVLLPYCGYRYQGYVGTSINTYGRYHTNLKGKPFGIFKTNTGCLAETVAGYEFFAVRLVRDVPAE